MKINYLFFSTFLTHVYRLWHRLICYRDSGDWQEIHEAVQQNKAVILAFWHNELFPISGFGIKQNNNYVVMISESKDGELIARIVEHLGHTTARGSSSRGGLKALIQMVRSIQQEKRVGIFTVDGPRGPRHEVKKGIILAAQRADALIFPVRAFSRRKFVFKSWDRFEIPWPFSICRIRVGAPLWVSKEKLQANILAHEQERLKNALDALG